MISRRFGERRVAEMPDAFFDEEAELPDTTMLEFVRSPIFPALSDTELQVRLGEAVAKLVKRARDDMELRGLPSWGATRCSARVSVQSRKHQPPEGIPARGLPQNRRPRE